MSRKKKILIVDDEKALRDSLRFLLESDYELFFAESGRAALDLSAKNFPDLVLLDVRLPDISGMEVLKHVKAIDPAIEVIMLTAVNTVNNAVNAIKDGAYDYITKPFDLEAIQTVISKAIEKKVMLRENSYFRELAEKKFQFENIIARSGSMKEIFKLIAQIADKDVTVLISGESGTGKELAARAIHNLSSRKNKLFVPVNCAAIPENLIESELFGHERGAFTGALERRIGKFEIADSGTIFLDEISSLPVKLQGKLLRAIQEREIERVGGGKLIPVDVRIISATNQDLLKQAELGNFRQDLFYRLNVVPVNLPPLRTRTEDIPLLAAHFIGIYNAEFGKKVEGLDSDALEALKKYNWPGNVRELENLIERLVVLNDKGVIGIDKLPKELFAQNPSEMSIDIVFDDAMNYKEASRRFEADFIKKALDKTGGNKNKAAKLMGLHRNTLLQKEKKLKK